ncbi:hypothetical protein D3C87_838780 [compost metagenome]|uniref:hypothetical protein n=1 Tax=Sphingobacterium TaxID=28453 RepID=UPI000F9F0071|nr:hypothetical protein [Sphingobacterium sp. GVS05A]
MKQIDLRQNRLMLKEQTGSLIARLFIYLLTIFTIVLPLSGLIANILNGGVTIVSIAIYAVFGLIAFYMLRVSLWNTYGSEIIHFQENKLNYTADYHWFKGGSKEFDFDKINFSIERTGYNEDNKGILIIKFDEKEKFETVSKLPLSDLEDLIIHLKELYNKQML